LFFKKKFKILILNLQQIQQRFYPMTATVSTHRDSSY
jgi:hypothetical protein